MALHPRLDRLDIKILARLQADGAMTNVKLSQAVNLSPSPCLQRVRRLEKAGFIRAYRAELDLAKLVENVTIFTEVTLSRHRREDFAVFEREARNLANLEEMHLISGGYDYLMKFRARNLEQYQDNIVAMLETTQLVKSYFSYVVIKTVHDQGDVALTALLSDKEREDGC